MQLPEQLEWDPEAAGYFVGTFAEGTLAVHILPMIYNHRVIVSVWRDGQIDALAGVVDAWCYSSALEALIACSLWNPDTEREPGDWIKHPFSGRRYGEPYSAST